MNPALAQKADRLPITVLSSGWFRVHGDHGIYVVGPKRKGEKNLVCTCASRVKCSHIFAVEFHLAKSGTSDIRGASE